eukprot:TRINITY_DN865_c0_g1_i3.p1 TRINITY_DN865_c0_g1~~TRINITY_DN865_c0_g1_i3.p1  ORF type:complete len:1250 (+),score=350.23 TRINITY_DN865_c0_g1_i3:202-3951(+)
MSLLKSVQRRSTIAWSSTPSCPDFIAAGTVAGTIGLDFDTSAQLELFKLDMKNPDTQLTPLGRATTSARFHKICWGSMGSTGSYPYGVIAGGMESGAVSIWNPAKIMNNEGAESLLGTHQKHAGAVQALDFNPYQANLLASGALDNEIFIWDLNNPSTPTVYTPGQKPPQPAEITCVAWNRKVQHILASATYNGTTTIWDLKAKRPVITFSDRKKPTRCRAMAWNPQEATQVLTASEDDDSPVLQLWDLRNVYTPVKYLEGHTRGVWGVSWSPFDNKLVVSCGKDNRTLCWHLDTASIKPGVDSATAQVLCDVETGSDPNTWNMDVQWSPRIPAVLSTTSLEGKVNIYALQDVGERNTSSEFGVTAQPTAGRVRHAPSWLQRPAGGSFGFGGSVASFTKVPVAVPQAATPGGPLPTPIPTPTPGSKLIVKRLETEHGLVAKSERLEEVIASNKFEEFCQEKVDSSTNEDEKQTWGFLKVLFNKGGRRQILSYLGYDEDSTRAELAKFAATLPSLPSSEDETEIDTPLSPAPATKEQKNEDEDTEEAEDTSAASTPAAAEDASQEGEEGQSSKPADVDSLFGAEASSGFDFGSIPPPAEPAAPSSPAPSTPSSSSAAAAPAAKAKKAGPPIHFFNSGDASEDMLTRAVLVGNFAAAVECCLRMGRSADALVLAACGGPELFLQTQETYFKSHPQPLATIMAPIVRGDLADLVTRADLSDWRAALATICTYSKSGEFGQLCGLLADRLATAGDNRAATLCYICAGNLEKTTNVWARSANARDKNAHADLQSFIEKVAIFRAALRSRGDLSDLIAQRYSEYAEILASQGRMPASLRYLSFLNDPKYNNTKGAELLDRVYHAQPTGQASQQAPPFPFTRVNVGAPGQPAQPAAPVQTPATTQQQPPSHTAAAHQHSHHQHQHQHHQHSHHQHQHQHQHGGYVPGGANVSPTSQPPTFPPAGTNVYGKPGQAGPPSSFPPPAGSGYPPYAGSYQAPPPTGQPQPVQQTSAPPLGYPQPYQPPTSTTAPPPSSVPLGYPQPYVPPSSTAGPPPTSEARPPVPLGYPQPYVPPSATGPPVHYEPPTSGYHAGGAPGGSGVAPPPVTQPPPVSNAPPPVAAPPPVSSAPPPTSSSAASTAAAPASSGSEATGDSQYVIESLNQLLEQTRQTSQRRPADQQKWADTSRRLAQLITKLQNGELSGPCVVGLQEMCQSLRSGNQQRAMEQQFSLVQAHSNQLGSTVVPALKRLIEMTKAQ